MDCSELIADTTSTGQRSQRWQIGDIRALTDSCQEGYHMILADVLFVHTLALLRSSASEVARISTSPPGLYKRLCLFAELLPSGPYRSAMALTSFLLCALFLASRSHGMQTVLEMRNSSDILPVCTCNVIAAAISSDSQVFFPRESFSH
jgi:hypothetical protein